MVFIHILISVYTYVYVYVYIYIYVCVCALIMYSQLWFYFEIFFFRSFVDIKNQRHPPLLRLKLFVVNVFYYMISGPSWKGDYSQKVTRR